MEVHITPRLRFEFGHSAPGVHIIRSKNQSSQYHTENRFGLVRGIKYFGIDQYRCTVSGLPLYIYINY